MLATPAVRRLARELGVDLEQVKGTGIGGTNHPGRRSRGRGAADHDAEASAAGSTKQTRDATVHRPAAGVRWPSKQNGSGPPPRRIPMLERKETPPIPPGEESIRIPFRGVRQAIAEHLRHSVTHAVHFTVMDEADVTALDERPPQARSRQRRGDQPAAVRRGRGLPRAFGADGATVRAAQLDRRRRDAGDRAAPRGAPGHRDRHRERPDGAGDPRRRQAGRAGDQPRDRTSSPRPARDRTIPPRSAHRHRRSRSATSARSPGDSARRSSITPRPASSPSAAPARASSSATACSASASCCR